MSSTSKLPSPLPSPSAAGPGGSGASLPFSRIPSISASSTPAASGVAAPGGTASPLTPPPFNSSGQQAKGLPAVHDVRDSGSDDLSQSGDRLRRNSSHNSTFSASAKSLPPAPNSTGRPPTASSLSLHRQRDPTQPSTPRMQTFLSMHGLAAATKSPAAAAASAPGSRIASGGTSPIPSTPVHTHGASSAGGHTFSQSTLVRDNSLPHSTLAGASGVFSTPTPLMANQSPRQGLGHGPAPSSSNIMVTVRMRPLSDRERQRGDHEVWGIDASGNVGQYDRTGHLVPKYHYDTVFGAQATNSDVYQSVAAPLIKPALDGINGTVFAYGVTSSGKTHTMLGTDTDPGILPSVIHDLFAQIAAVTSQHGQGQGQGQGLTFSVRLSMMEIYNEVLNDLLDPTRTNLKVFEDASRGVVVVEGLAEEPVASASAALAAVSRGEQHRKVGCTAMNEDSSRSHTLCRLVIESTRAVAGGGGVVTTSASLCLIDLAGSESARATVSRGQRMEGAYINKSLLTLGTVIHKLAAGHATHVPFRDSKLTRLLQNSMSGPGARIAIVCNITPAAAQGEETANTLKFATRAKLVRVSISRNEVLDDAVLVRLYRSEIMELKRQVAALLSSQGLSPGSTLPGSEAPSPAAPGPGIGSDPTVELRSLQQQLERERQARHRLEQEKALLEQRLRGLTHLMLNDASALQSTQGVRAAAAAAGLRPGATGAGGVRGSPGRGSMLPSAPGVVMRRSEPNGPLFSQASTGAVTPTPTASSQHRRSRSDVGIQGGSSPSAPPDIITSRYSVPAVVVITPGSTGDARFGGAQGPGMGARGRGLNDRYAGGGRSGGGASAVGDGEELGDGEGEEDEDEETCEAESEALLSTIMAMQEELKDGADSVGRSSARSDHQRASPSHIPHYHTQSPLPRHPNTGGAGRPPLSHSSGGSPSHVAAAPGAGAGTAGAGQLQPADSYGLRTAGSSVLGDSDKDLEIQVLLADREVLQDQIVQVELHNEQLSQENDNLQMEVQTLHLEREKARRMLRELEGDMVALRTFKNQTHAELEALSRQNAQLQAALASGRGGLPAGLSAGVGGPAVGLYGAAAPSVQGRQGDAAALPALQQQLQQLGTGGAFGVELRAVNPEVYRKLERLEQQINVAMNGAVARNQQLEAMVSVLQRDKQALLEAAGLGGGLRR